MEPNSSPVVDFHAHYARQPDFLPRLLEAMDRAGVDRICLCTAGEGFDKIYGETAAGLLRL